MIGDADHPRLHEHVEWGGPESTGRAPAGVKRLNVAGFLSLSGAATYSQPIAAGGCSAQKKQTGESMNTKAAMALAVAALMALPAGAQELTPAARLQLQFGGGRPPEGLRLSLLAEARDWRPDSGGEASPLAVASLELGLGQRAYSTLLGQPLRSRADRAQAAEGRSGGTTWLWIGAGVVGAVAVAALAAGGGSEEVNTDRETDVTVNCGIGGNVLSPGGPDIDLGGCAP